MVLAVTSGGESDDREILVIEDEMDGLRTGGWLSEGEVRSQLASKRGANVLTRES